jgi:hypothetical protein
MPDILKFTDFPKDFMAVFGLGIALFDVFWES